MLLLERESTLASLDTALTAAAAGRGSVALVHGEAGIGKTSVVRGFLEQHSNEGRVLWGICDDLSTPRTFGPLLDVVDDVTDELRAALSGEGFSDGLFGLVLAELKRSPTPVVFVIEDLHWADEATLDLVIFLSRRIESVPALLVLTYRAEEMEVNGALVRALGRIPPLMVRRLALVPLSVDAVAALVGNSAKELHSITGGNPFYVSELLAAPGIVPRSVTDTVLARVSALPPISRRLLDLIALSPGRVETSLLDVCAPGWHIAAVEPERRGMLTVERHSVSFRHEIARQAVASTIPAAHAAQLHRTLLSALINARADPAQIAHHAAAAGDADALLKHGIEAARLALRGSSNREAVAQFRRVAPLADRLEPSERADLYEDWSTAAVAAGEIEAAADIAQRVVPLRRAVGDVEGTGRALSYLSRVQWSLGRGAEGDRLLSEARAVLSERPPGSALAQVLSLQAIKAMMTWRLADARPIAKEAVELAEHLGDEGVLAYALMVAGTTNLVLGIEDTATVERSMELSRGRGDYSQVCLAYCNLAETAIEHRQLARAEHYLDVGDALVEEHEEVSVAGYLTSLRSRLEFLRGNWTDAESLANSVLDQPGGSVVNTLNALHMLARLYARRGDREAEVMVGRFAAAAEPTHELQRIVPAAVARAEWAELHGNLAAERHQLRALYREVTVTGVPWAIGEVALWLSRAGGLEAVPPGASEAFRYELEGRRERAAQAWAEAGCVYEQADALAHSNDPEGLLAALPLVDALGASAASNRVRGLLRRAGLRPPRAPRRTTREHPAGLTERQAEVLALLAEGLTNAEIADRLIVSVRTVDHHVAAILARLGVESRRQAVEIARKFGLAARA